MDSNPAEVEYNLCGCTFDKICEQTSEEQICLTSLAVFEKCDTQLGKGTGRHNMRMPHFKKTSGLFTFRHQSEIQSTYDRLFVFLKDEILRNI